MTPTGFRRLAGMYVSYATTKASQARSSFEGLRTARWLRVFGAGTSTIDDPARSTVTRVLRVLGKGTKLALIPLPPAGLLDHLELSSVSLHGVLRRRPPPRYRRWSHPGSDRTVSEKPPPRRVACHEEGTTLS
jgi:hypothetical protein